VTALKTQPADLTQLSRKNVGPVSGRQRRYGPAVVCATWRATSERCSRSELLNLAIGALRVFAKVSARERAICV